MDNKALENVLKSAAEKVETALDNTLCGWLTGETIVAEAMRYSTLGGGKRIRAFLVLEFCRLFGGDERAAISYACALECVHAYSLIHDDLPCMDDDDLRRGKPSCHKQFGEAEALLAGDGLLTAAFGIISSNDTVSDRSARLAATALAREAGADGMICGQTLDIADKVDTYEDLKTIYLKKTSALLAAACLLGYYAAVDQPREDDIARIRCYADNVGLAFQIHDDILDVISDTETLGKMVGSDEKNNKKTALAFFSIDEAMEEEARLTKLATDAISSIDGSETLTSLAHWLLSRKK